MNYNKMTKSELIVRIEELEQLNQQLMEEKAREDRLDFSWTGNLGHWYYNIVTGTVNFNPLKVQALGLSVEEVPERVHYSFFTDKVHPEDYQHTMQVMKDHMKGLLPVYDCEYRIQAKDGSWRWFHDRGKITRRGPEGQPLFAAGIVFDITAQKMEQESLKSTTQILEVQASTDALTEIPNRRGAMEELLARMYQSRDADYTLSIAIMDIDHFKAINDTYGHLVGDQVLKELANVLKGSIRGLDSVSRFGGEEFLLIFPKTSGENAVSVCDRIRKRIQEHHFSNGIPLTVSAGVAVYQGQKTKEELLEEADKNLYNAKNNGRNQVIGPSSAP